MTLSSRDLHALHDQLRALRSHVSGAVTERFHRHGLEVHDAAALPNRRADTDDEGSAELATSLDIAHVSRNAATLAELDAALARLEAGEYGICVDCGEEISRERLLANPAADRCCECQERSEHAARVARRTHA